MKKVISIWLVLLMIFSLCSACTPKKGNESEISATVSENKEDENEMKGKDFKRLFSLTMHKDKYFSLAAMTFFKDFINGKNGNMYPRIDLNGDFKESVSNGKYSFQNASDNAYSTRFFARLFPYASYEFTADALNGNCGFDFISSGSSAKILFGVKGGKVYCDYNGSLFESDKEFAKGMSFIVTLRSDNADVYIKQDGYADYLTSFKLSDFENIAYYDNYSKAIVGFVLAGNGSVITDVRQYMDCGISQADIRPVKYENGEIMVENGKVYLTMSIRQIEGGYQGVFSWVPGTNEFEMTGAVFFDAGDGLCGNDVASSLKYNRETEEWYLWVCSFSHEHILGYASFKGDVRFGKNIVDITLMDKMTENSKDTEFWARKAMKTPILFMMRKTTVG